MSLRALVLALAALPTPLLAQSVLDATDPAAILNVVRGYGSGSLETGTDGDPLIRARIEGEGYTVHFYGCTEGKACKSVQFLAAWVNPGKIGLDEVNAWNRDRRFGTAYIDDENDPVLEMNINLDFGVTVQNFDDTVDYWQNALKKFRVDVLDK